ncbi:MAG: hypothetical protein M0Z45_01195 [Actinomycetota bacterium]|nr:hypothetical protein [Actinomycetota bacterium]
MFSTTIARKIAAAIGIVLILLAAGLILTTHFAADKVLSARRTSQRLTATTSASTKTTPTTTPSKATTTTALPAATTEPVVAHGQLQSGTYYDKLEIIPDSLPSSSYPHYTVTLTSSTTGSIQGEITMHYQDGSTRHVLSFVGSVNDAAGTIDIVTVAPAPEVTPGGVPESSLMVGSKINATYDSAGITFISCSSYLHWVSWTRSNVSPPAVNPNACTFVPFPPA